MNSVITEKFALNGQVFEVGDFKLSFQLPSRPTEDLEEQGFDPNDEVTIVDINGKLVCKNRITEAKSILNIAGLEDGIYLANYKGINNFITQKLVKTCN